tara:strand:- start:173 stop:811 length:639 start_codon:yes stop_codon:yes gene_type:complete
MKKDSDIEKELAQTLIHSLTKSLFASGFFTEEDIKDKDSHRLALKRVIENGGIDAMTIDYTQSLVTKARNYRKSKEYDLSRICYATFFEHQINNLIHLYCLRNEINNKTQTDIIQSVNIYGKFTWLLKLMQYPDFNTNHRKTIKNLADSRNSFVHYKWKDEPTFQKDIDDKKEQEKLDIEFDKIEKAVKYFKTYCSRIKYKGKKEHIKNLVK